ncbi:hypothetical protein [Paenibacillus sp. y28]
MGEAIDIVMELLRLMWPFVAIVIGIKLIRYIVKNLVPAIKLWFNERTM